MVSVKTFIKEFTQKKNYNVSYLIVFTSPKKANMCERKKICSNTKGTSQSFFSKGCSLVKNFQSKNNVMVKEANKCEHAFSSK